MTTAEFEQWSWYAVKLRDPAESRILAQAEYERLLKIQTEKSVWDWPKPNLALFIIVYCGANFNSGGRTTFQQSAFPILPGKFGGIPP